MTDDELHELYTLIDTLGVRPCEKQRAIERLEKKGLIARKEGRSVGLTPTALSALGKMRMT